MINILITGARGFLGNSLRINLNRNLGVRVLEFCREDSDELLEEYIKFADFIYHFAGEVRANSSNQAFESSNSELTHKMIHILSKHSKKIPILLTSTIHAIDPKNIYGITKQESEKAIEEYSRKNNISVWIYRLPHVFGPGCKPNYNSVITTWIYNSINGLEVNIFDRDIKMSYCYSIDLVNCFIGHIESNFQEACFYLTPSNIYTTTLGEVADLISSFKHTSVDSNLYLSENPFEQKLYTTYQSYLYSTTSVV